jgi:quercetin dioxygenase-like cupin family protein
MNMINPHAKSTVPVGEKTSAFGRIVKSVAGLGLLSLALLAAAPLPSHAEEKPGTIVTNREDVKWKAVGPLDQSGRGIFVSILYGELETKGPTNFLMKYSAGIEAPPHTHSSDYYSVVVSGRFRHFLASESESDVLTAGASWFQKGDVVHGDRCVGPEDCVLDIFWPQGFDVEFVKAK